MLQPETRQATILVADDLEAYRCLLNDLLEEQGYQVVCAGDGDEALKVITQPSRRLGVARCDDASAHGL